MAAAPNVSPALGATFPRAYVDVLTDLDGATRRQVVWMEAGSHDRWPQHVGLQSRKRGCQEDIIRTAVDQHLLMALVGHAFAGRNELGTHIGEIAAEHFCRTQRDAVADAASQHDEAIEKRAHGADK